MIRKQHYNIYIASCEKDGGIYQYHLFKDGSLKKVGFTPMDRPMYMAVDNKKMYILLRAPFESSNESGLVIYDMDSDGGLKNPSEIIPTKGEVACHLTVDCGNVYCVNYISGNAIKLPDKLVQHYGRGINPKRQEGPHTHFVGLTPDKKYLCVTDLGLDSIFLYDKDFQKISKVKVPDGHGVRHLVFSNCGKICFAANELESTLSAFEYGDGKLKLLDTVSCLKDNFNGKSAAGAIRFNDNKIYVSNRGHDSISVFSFKDSKLILEGIYPCGGMCPRDFDIFGEYIVSVNQNSDNLTVMSLENFEIVHTESDIKTPVCVNKCQIFATT